MSKNSTNAAATTVIAIAKMVYGCDEEFLLTELGEMNPADDSGNTWYISDPYSDGEFGADLEIEVREDGYYYRSHPFFCDNPNGYYEEPTEWTLYVPDGLAEAIDEMVGNVSSPEYTEELTTVRDLKIMRGTEIREICRKYDERITNRKATLRAEGRWFDRKEEQRIPLSKDAVVCSMAGSAADSVVKIDDACTVAYNKGYALGCKVKAWFKRGE